MCTAADEGSSLSRIRRAPKLLVEHLVFRLEILDHLGLLTIDPAGQKHGEQLPGLEDVGRDRMGLAIRARTQTMLAVRRRACGLAVVIPGECGGSSPDVAFHGV